MIKAAFFLEIFITQRLGLISNLNFVCKFTSSTKSIDVSYQEQFSQVTFNFKGSRSQAI